MSAPDTGRMADEAADLASNLLTPTARLELSRARMRVFLEKRKSPGSGDSMASSVGEKVSAWSAEMRANPLLGAVVDAVQAWWVSHPLRSVALMAGDAIEDVAAPWIRRYPIAVVGGAVAVGVVVSRLRPWRWLGRPALFAGLASQVASQLMTHAPLEFLIDTFTQFAKPKVKPKATAAPSPDIAASDQAAVDAMMAEGPVFDGPPPTEPEVPAATVRPPPVVAAAAR